MTRAARAGERSAVVNRFRQAHGFGEFAHPVLAQLYQGLKNGIAESLLGIYAKLRKDIVLALDSRHRLVDIGKDGALLLIIRRAKTSL
jgi:hypothetical protein